MSLNGLDSNVVVQAHQTALNEAGGWFLLKYANRDTVELLDKGTGGVTEARNAVERYEEKSPLYGLVQHRRKKVILKYVPEGTSRLLQVRLVVQFQSILDTFIPHDTVFSFTAADELTDSTLGLCTMKLQHAASTTSSSSSLRQRRLNGIAEDTEEGATSEVAAVSPVMHAMASTVSNRGDDTNTLPASALRAKALLAQRRQEYAREEHGIEAPPNFVEHTSETENSMRLLSDVHERPVSPLVDTNASILDKTMPTKSEEGQPKVSLAISRPSFDFPLPDPAMDSDKDDRRPIPKEHPSTHYSSHLTAAESSNISRWTDDVVASTKKQKRAPRPHVDAQLRPKTSGNFGCEGASRRIANLPTSVRVSNRVSVQPSRPISQQSTQSVPARFVPSLNPPPPISSSAFPLVSQPRPVSRPSPSRTSSMVNDSSAITPEKMRLMKALQMHKRNQLLAQRSGSAASSVPLPYTSTDSSNSEASDSPTAQSTSMSSFSANPEVRSTDLKLGSIDDSETMPPTSVVPATENHSTMLSSFSETSGRHRSQTSLSSDTNSSTTPRAESDGKRQQNLEIEGAGVGESSTDAIHEAPASQIVPSQPKIDQHTDNEILPQDLAETSRKVSEVHEHEDRGRPLIGGGPQNASNTSLSPLPRGRKKHHLEVTLNIPPSTLGSEFSDDELMEELQHATVHEAKPVSVNRTPVTSVLQMTPTKELQAEEAEITRPRSVSIESQISTFSRRRIASRAGSIRSISATLPQWPPPSNEPVPALPKQKPVIGSNISRRIKVLEGLSQRDNNLSAGPTKESAPRVSPLSTMLKRTSFLASSPNVDTMPERTPTGLIQLPLPTGFENEYGDSGAQSLVDMQGVSSEDFTSLHKGESLTVTARIIRDPPKSSGGTSDVTGLHRSPLIVEHEVAENTDTPAALLPEQQNQALESVVTSPSSERRRFSFSSHRSGTQKLPSSDPKPQGTPSQHKASKPSSETSSVTEDKRTSRASRMFKRLSSFGVPRKSKESLASPTRDGSQAKTIQEQTEIDSGMRHVVDIGEVNVQFPETLLWKRRFLRVDDQGYLIFATPSNGYSVRGRSRKIHLDEFTKPSLPDKEREEMAWSIVLDLKDGRCVQCACESRKSQILTLTLLTDAHSAYHQLYPAS